GVKGPASLARVSARNCVDSSGGENMGRPYGSGRVTCESRISIDVRRWNREGRLHAGHSFTCSWTFGGKPFGSIKVRTEADAVILMYRARSWGNAEWKSVEQRVPITWTACHLGGRRPCLSVPFTPMVDTAGAGSQCCTAPANCSHADALVTRRRARPRWRRSVKVGGGSSLSWTRTTYIFPRPRTSGRTPSRLRD